MNLGVQCLSTCIALKLAWVQDMLYPQAIRMLKGNLKNGRESKKEKMLYWHSEPGKKNQSHEVFRPSSPEPWFKGLQCMKRKTQLGPIQCSLHSSCSALWKIWTLNNQQSWTWFEGVISVQYVFSGAAQCFGPGLQKISEVKSAVSTINLVFSLSGMQRPISRIEPWRVIKDGFPCFLN